MEGKSQGPSRKAIPTSGIKVPPTTTTARLAWFLCGAALSPSPFLSTSRIDRCDLSNGHTPTAAVHPSPSLALRWVSHTYVLPPPSCRKR